MSRTLTARFVETVAAPAEGRIDYPDAALPGFRFRVTSTGAKSFSILYRAQGRQVRETIGSYPAIDLATARQLARESLQRVARGENPHAVKRAARKAGGGPDTVRNLGQRYIDRYCKPNLRSWKEVDRLFRLHVWPELGDRIVHDIVAREVFDFIDRLVKAGLPVQANRVLTRLNHFFGWLVQTFVLAANPAADVKRPTKEAPRERSLSDDELRAVLRACDAIGYPFGPVVKMLAYTGQRRDECADLSWSEIPEGAKEWLIPGGRTKNKRPHLVPLTAPVLQLLAGLPRFKSGDFAFTTTGGRRPFSGFVKAKRRLDEASKVTDWTLHDLRRTVGTGMARLGIGSDIRGRVLNHSKRNQGGVTDAVYNAYDYLPEKRRALELWAQHVDGLLNPQPNVVPLRSAPSG
jgi:integrase